MQHCYGCGTYRFFPSHLCPDCGSDEQVWGPCSRHGTIYSVTETYVPIAGFEDRGPYLLTMIEVLKNDTVDLMREAFARGRYDYVAEGRTFK